MKRFAVIVAPAAAQQARVIAEWWRSNHLAVADLFEGELDAILVRLAVAPARASKYVESKGRLVRRLLMARTSHHVYFEIDDEKGRVNVLAVACARSCRPSSSSPSPPAASAKATTHISFTGSSCCRPIRREVMKPSSPVRSSFSRLSTLLLGSLSFGVAACGTDIQADEPIAQVQEAIDNGWKPLVLKTGWTNQGSPRIPSVGKVNGVVTFRGTITGSASATPIMFTLPLEFRPSGAHAGAADMRTIVAAGVGGTVFYNLNTFEVSIYQDGWGNLSTLGPAARLMTSLDGVSFDQNAGQTLAAGTDWEAQYPFRQDGSFGVFVKTTPDNFVRLQGFILRPQNPTNPDGFLFNLPSAFRPGNTVFVPVNLAGRVTGQTWGYISINTNGDVYVPWNVQAANLGTSLEGVWFSKTLSGNETLAFKNGWGKYSARSVKVGKYGDVVRFQGAVAGGTTDIIGQLPTSMRPAKDINVVGVANGPAPAKLLIKTNGDIQVLSPPLDIAKVMVSLDGVSFWN